VDPGELAQARRDAIAAKPQLKAYISAPVKGQLVSGDVWLAQLWSGDTNQAQAEQPAIAYVIPKEGCSIWNDALCMPASARHRRAAHEWMNYILRPEVGAAISRAIGYGSPNVAATKLLDHPVASPPRRSSAGSSFRSIWAWAPPCGTRSGPRSNQPEQRVTWLTESPAVGRDIATRAVCPLAPGGTMSLVKDPVCGMQVDTGRAAASETHRNVTHHFCSTACATAFRADPDRYTASEGAEPPYTATEHMTAPKFGSAGSGGLENEPGPERRTRP
jgi:YHS domain-containing protein